MYLIKHLLSEPEKTSSFTNDNEFIIFVKAIAMENGDTAEIILDSVDECIDYINDYCDNLKLIIVGESLKINSEDNSETITITIDRVKHPTTWENKKKSLINSGLTEEEAEKDLTKNPCIVMELCYDIDLGAFLVESEAVGCTDIYNPYSGQILEIEEN